MVTVTWASQDTCELFSPQVPVGCDSARLSLTIIGTGTVSSNPSGLVCIGPTVGACLADWAPQTPIVLQASVPPTSWGGDCAGFGAAQVGTVILGGNASVTTCTVTFP